MININEVSINLERLKITKLNINHLLTLIKIYFISCKEFFDYTIDESDARFLQKNQFIVIYKEKNIKYFLRDKGKIILDQIVKFKYPTPEEIKKSIKKDKADDFEIKIKKYRNKFNGLKLGSMGNLQDVKTKLRRWMKNNPDVSFKEILEATDLYIESLNGNYNYLQRADYFIYKQNRKKEETSRLSIFIEEIRKEPENSDWTTNLV